MYITGPNIRKDYHLEQGEELFLQLKGKMLLETWEHGVRKSVWINEGEIFVLPGRVPHSPNRFADTLGLVIERERAEDELDVLRYYIEGATRGDEILYQEVFHCEDLGAQLVPVIQRFFASEEFKTGKPDPAKLPYLDPFPIDTTVDLEPPFSLVNGIEKRISEEPVFWLFERPEFRVRVRKQSLQDEAGLADSEKLLWVYKGQCTLKLAGESIELAEKDHFLVPKAATHQIDVPESSILIEIWMAKSQSG